MKTIEFTQAFINANDAVLNHVDAIEETRALSELIDACKERMGLSVASLSTRVSSTSCR